MRVVTLSAIKAGMTRLRDKGGASPQTLYELTNGHVDASGSPTIRPGTVHDASLPAGTKGLCAFAGKLHVFATQQLTAPPGYVINILKHPDPTYVGGLFKIHFAKPYLGFLYVVAEFEDGNVYHYWMQGNNTWQANHQYQTGDYVSPSVENGYLYKASPISAPPAWSPSTRYSVGDVVQPTTYNGWKYTVIAADGENPTSGTTEPAWPTTDGGQVNDDDDQTTVDVSLPSNNSSGSPAGDRYDNLAGFQ